MRDDVPGAVGSPGSGDRLGDQGSHLGRLEKALVDVEGDIRDLEARLACLVGLHERLDELVARLEQDGAGGAEGSPGRLPEPETVPIVRPEPMRRGLKHQLKHQLKRLARLLIRISLGTVRRIWQAAEPPPREDHVLPAVSPRPAGPPPMLLVLLDDPGATAARCDIWLEALGRQTVGQLTVAVLMPGSSRYRIVLASGGPWSPGAELDRAELNRADLCEDLGSGHVIRIDPALPPMQRATLEQLQWVLLTEGVDMAVLGAAHSSTGSLVMHAASSWSAEPRPTADGSTGPTGRVVGKLVGEALADSSEAGLDLLVPAGLRRVGPYLVEAATRRRLYQLELQPLAPVGDAAPPIPGQAIMILTTALPGIGTDRLLAAVIEAAAGLTTVVVALDDGPAPVGRRLDCLEHAGAIVYRPACYLAPELWPSVIEHLAARYRVGRLVHVGDGTWWCEHAAQLAAHLEGVRILDVPITASRAGLPDPGVDLLALTGPLARRLTRLGAAPEQVRRCDGWRLAAGGAQARVAPQRVEEVRDELGVPPGAHLVLAVADLVPEHRPEQLVCLAQRLEQERREAGRGSSAVVVLVGDGPLVASVHDLARMLGVTSFAVRAPRHDLGELAAAADVACSLSEADPVPVWPMAALAAGTPLVATAADDLPMILGQPWASACPAVAIETGSGLDALLAAVREQLDQTDRAPGALGVRRDAAQPELPTADGSIDALRQALGLAGA